MGKKWHQNGAFWAVIGFQACQSIGTLIKTMTSLVAMETWLL